MANIINQNANDYWARLFQPNTTTSKTTINENEDLNILGLLSLLAFIPGLFGGGNKGKDKENVEMEYQNTSGLPYDNPFGKMVPKTTSNLAATPIPAARPDMASVLGGLFGGGGTDRLTLPGSPDLEGGLYSGGAKTSAGNPSAEQIMSILLQLFSGLKTGR